MNKQSGSGKFTHEFEASVSILRLWVRAMRLRFSARLELRTVLHTKVISNALGWLLLGACLMPLSIDIKLSLRVLALRRFERGIGLRLTQRAMRRWLTYKTVPLWREHRIGWHRYYGNFGNITSERALKNSLLLKEPGPNGEKGVLYSSFEYNWMKIIVNHDARSLFRDYYLVGASSWSPSDYAVFSNLSGLSEDPAFIGVSNLLDIAQYNVFAPNIYPLPIMACDWCDPDFFQPRSHDQRDIDILMVAHFAQWKRHWLLFEALRRMPKSLNVVLIGREGPGGTERDIKAKARAFGVPQDLTILSGLEIEDVVKNQCNAKLSTIFSKREGSCVAVTEALFADSPVVMMRDSHIGARAYINPNTGRIAGRHNLHHTLMDMLERSSTYSPRTWACANIPARKTSERLNSILKDYSLRSGQPWTNGIAPMCWRYVPRYLEVEDAERLRPGLNQLRERHGIVLEEFVSEADARRRNVSRNVSTKL